MQKRRILIVEDEAIVARDLSHQLSELGYEPVAQTTTGEEALVMAEQLRPDLVLMDVHLAGSLDGIATAQTIRERFSIPVVFVTAFLEDAILDRAKTAQPYGYLTKPFQSIELRMTIDMAITKHQAEAQMSRIYEEQAAILRTATDGFWLVDSQARLIEVNDAYCRMSGYTRDELLRMSIPDLVTIKSPREIAADMEKMRQSGSARFETRHQCKDGHFIHFEASVNYMPTSDGRFFCFLRDITERKVHEAEIERLNGLYLALSQVNQLITRVKTREELLAGVCQMLVQYGHLKLAWVGWFDPQTKAVIPLAQHGDIGGYLNEIKISADDSPHVRGPTGTAVRESRTVVCNDFMHDAPTELWHEAGARQGFGSSSAFPIRYEGLVCGALTVYAGELGFFRDKEVRLFEEAAMDVSFALDHLEKERQKQQAEEALRKVNERFDLAARAAHIGVWDWDIVGDNLVWDDRMYDLYGVKREAFSGAYAAWIKGLHPDDVARCEEETQQALRGEKDYDTEFRIVWPDGTIRHLKTMAVVVRDAAGNPVREIGINIDITERKRAEEALQHSHDLMRYIIEHSRSAIAVHDRNMLYVYVSQRYLDEYKVKENDIIGKHHYDVFPDLPQKWRNIHQKALAGELSSADDDPYVRADGIVDWTRWECRPWHEADGSIGGIIVYTEVITERKRAELALRESESRFREIADNAQDWIWETDTDGKYTFASQVVEKVVGYTPEEILEKHFYDLFHPDDRESLKAAALAAFNLKQPFRDFNNRNVHKNGQTVWLATSGIPRFDANGSFLGYRGVDTNITERKLAEEELQRISKWLLRTQQISKVGGWTINTKTDEVWVSPEARRIYGASDDEPLTISHIQSFPLLHCRPMLNLALRELVAHSKPYDVEFQITRRTDGAIVDIHSLAEYNASEASVMGVIEDITEHKRSETQIKKLSSAVEQSPASIVITDSKGAIEYVNPKFTKLTGYALEDVRGQNPRVLKGDKISADEYRRLWESITHGQEWHGEFHNRKKNGDFYWESAVISPIVDAHGHTTHYLAVKEDITDRKVLEEQFRQSQKLESIGQLAGGVAHDFNNILAAMMMRLSFMQKNTSADMEALAELTADAKRAASLTRQLLLFSRRSVMEVELLDLNELVANVLKMLSRLIGEHITMQFQRRDGLPGVEADAGMMEQVVMNLALNARDAMLKGGRLTIRVEPVQIDEEQVKGNIKMRLGQFVCLSVADNGCGMDETTLNRIFEPFFTTKEVGKGTGLGLATVHGIVAQHKGWVDVESELGKGTKFKVFIPATTQRRTEPTTTEKISAIQGHETILLVEDETILRQLVAQGLRQLGYRVLEADNGQAAMKLWQEHSQHIDLLFSDMVMPEGFTGLDLAEKLRQEKTSLKVIISSGYNVETAGHGKPTAGGIVYFQKPYEFEVLSKTIRDCLDRA